MKKNKDLRKVEAGRIGGQKSGGNFKHNRNKAKAAGHRSAWRRQKSKLSKFRLNLIDGVESFAYPDDRR